jgi:hypothetical protein
MLRMTGLFGLTLVVALGSGCGSSWRMHQERVVADAKPSTATAPDWVRGTTPSSSDGMIYFVGRSHTPDMHKRAGSDGSTPDGRVGYTVMDERDAIQSARTDVYDQIRQRLQPRNFGTTGQALTGSVDSGTCIDCGQSVPLVRTGLTSCNDPCYSSAKNPWQTSSRRSGNCGTCSAADVQHVQMPGGCGSCDSIVGSAAGGGSAPTSSLSGVMQAHRQADFLPVPRGEMARDLNLANIGIDSVMPALLARLEEREAYFEKWQVHESDDFFARPLATGADEWESYKCWVLFAIPREEFDAIAKEFRSKYEMLYDQTWTWMCEDRARRVSWEDDILRTQLAWQNEEREWNRADELLEQQHQITLDKDRETMPGRRFRLVGSDR